MNSSQCTLLSQLSSSAGSTDMPFILATKLEVFAAEGRRGKSLVETSPEASVEVSKFSSASINSGGALNHLN